jgi:hypothetical protein
MMITLEFHFSDNLFRMVNSSECKDYVLKTKSEKVLECMKRLGFESPGGIIRAIR